MAESTIAHSVSRTKQTGEALPREIASRSERGLALFRERHAEMVWIAPWTYRMPSASHPSFYFTTIKPEEESCTCPDYLRHGEEEDFFCKHMFAASIFSAKSGECFGCGKIRLRRDLCEVMDFHESLTFFEGDQLCRDCAVNHGIL